MLADGLKNLKNLMILKLLCFKIGFRSINSLDESENQSAAD